MDLVLVDDLPASVSLKIGHALRFVGIVEHFGDGTESITDTVIGMADGVFGGDDIDFGNRVVRTIDHGVNAQTEQVLVVLSIHLGSNDGSVGSSIFIQCKNLSVELTGSLDLKLDGTILIKVVVQTVIVISS